MTEGEKASSSGDSLDRLLDAFLERHRRGEKPSITEYEEEHPEMAGEIRQLFTAILMMEEVNPEAATEGIAGKGSLGPPNILGEYRILREIGRGGMGVVYEAEQTSLGRHVALKVLPFHSLLDAKVLERFRREAKAAATLHHTHIVPVFGVGEHEGVHYYAMQFIQGRPLDEVIGEIRRLRKDDSSAFSVLRGSDRPSEPHTQHEYSRSVAGIGLQVAEALSYAHGEGVLHRDIKPSNLILDGKGTAWVSDFGLAKSEGTSQLTISGDVVGTLAYMAPERFDGWSDPRSDVYGLGLTLYELLTLRPAFRDTNRDRLIKKVTEADPRPPSRFARDVPRDLETIVIKAIAKDPGERYQTAAQLADDLRLYLAGEPIHARRSGTWERVWKWAKRRPAAAALIGVSTMALLTVASVSVWYSSQLEDALVESERLGYYGYISAADGAVTVGALREARRWLDECEVDLRGWEWSHLRLRCDAALTTFRGLISDHEVMCVAFSADGERIAASANEDISIWNTESGDLLMTLEDPIPDGDNMGDVYSVAFSPDGMRLVSGAHDGLVVWDLSSRELVAVRRKPPVGQGDGDEEPSSVEFSPSGEQIVSAGGRRVRTWTAGLLEPLLSLSHDDYVWSVAFSPDGRRIVSAGNDGIRLWDAESGSPLLHLAHEGAFGVSFAPDGDRISSVALDGTVHIWDLDTGQSINDGSITVHPVGILSLPPRYHVMDWSRSRLIVGNAPDGIVRFQDVSTDTELSLYSHDDEVGPVALSPDGRKFVSASRESLHVADAGFEGAVRTFSLPCGYVHGIDTDAKGLRAVTYIGSEISVWNVLAGERELPEARLELQQEGKSVTAVAMRADGEQVAYAVDDETIRVWTLDSHEDPLILEVSGSVSSLEISADGKYILSGSSSRMVVTQTRGFWQETYGTARLWDVAEGREISSVIDPNAGVTAVTLITEDKLPFTPKEFGLMTASENGRTIAVESAKGDGRALDLAIPFVNALSIAFGATAADGSSDERFAIGASDGLVSLWAPRAGRQVLTLRGHDAPVHAVNFGPDMSWLVSADSNGTVKIWDARSPQEIFDATQVK